MSLRDIGTHETTGVVPVPGICIFFSGADALVCDATPWSRQAGGSPPWCLCFQRSGYRTISEVYSVSTFSKKTPWNWPGLSPRAIPVRVCVPGPPSDPRRQRRIPRSCAGSRAPTRRPSATPRAYRRSSATRSTGRRAPPDCTYSSSRSGTSQVLRRSSAVQGIGHALRRAVKLVEDPLRYLERRADRPAGERRVVRIDLLVMAEGRTGERHRNFDQPAA